MLLAALVFGAVAGFDDSMKALTNGTFPEETRPDDDELEEGARRRLVESYDGETSLHVAARSGNAATVKKLIEEGAKVGARSKDG